MGAYRTTFAAACLLLGPLAYSQAQNVPEADDGYHLAEWLNAGHLANYTEWWYFNLYDSSNNVQAIFSYLISNPFNLPGGFFPIGISEMAAVAYTNSGMVTEADAYPAQAFSAEYSQANVQIGRNAVTVIDRDTYHVTGATRDRRIVWDLTYQRSAPSWFAAQRNSVADPSWELMSWLLYMPSARVTGVLTVDGTVHQINTTGYHDHNWGEWDLTGVPWNWAQYSQPNLTFDLGDFPNKPGGAASVELNGSRYVFQNSQYTLTHTTWAYDPVNKVNYPTQSLFQADNGTAQVTLTMNVLQTDPLSAPVPAGSPNAIIYEQTVAYSGQVSINATPTSVAGNGFREYTAVTQ